MRIAACALTMIWAQACHAIDLTFPVDCKLGETCFIQYYVDADPSADHSDFSCNELTYDGHSGTDVALPAARDMDAGIAVLAAASGTVTALRDGMAEHLPGDTVSFPEGQDCGNGLMIAHDDGWDTKYCHLRTGSIWAQTGDYIEAGQKIGEIGMSGRTSFPHLHMTVEHDGKIVDPFDPKPDESCGAPMEDQLWTTPITYQPGGLLQIGFSPQTPEYNTIKIGDAHSAQITTDQGALVLWVHLFGTMPRDQVRLSIEGPQGSFYDEKLVLNRTYAQAFRSGGRRLHSGNTVPGEYFGKATLFRDGEVLGTMTTSVMLE